MNKVKNNEENIWYWFLIIGMCVYIWKMERGSYMIVYVSKYGIKILLISGRNVRDFISWYRIFSNEYGVYV